MENGKLFARRERESVGERESAITFRVASEQNSKVFFFLYFIFFYCIPLMWMPSGRQRGEEGGGEGVSGVSCTHLCKFEAIIIH